MAFLDEPGRIAEIEERIRTWIRSCAGHPAVFCYIIGNEIPASIVRWHGRRRVEKFIERLYRIAKEEDPDALVTYVNYPSTEYLRLPFRSEEHTSELQSLTNLVCRLLLEKKNKT